MRTEQRVIAAAIRVGNVIWTLPRPARHHTVIALMNASGANPHIGEQGFLIASDDLSEGPFVSRWRACQIARTNGQITLERNRELFSEDLW